MTDSAHYLVSALHTLADEERATAERALAGIARAAALGDLTADIAHDMANPLFAIMGLVDLMLMDAEAGSTAQEYLSLVQKTSLELRDDLRSLLDFARPPEAAPPAALDAATRHAVQLVRHGHGKELALVERYPPEPLLVHCGPGPAAEAAVHLVAAARVCAGDGGEIEVDVIAQEAWGVLRFSPVEPGGIALVAASRIALDNGGSLDFDGTAAVLRLPRWVG